MQPFISLLQMYMLSKEALLTGDNMPEDLTDTQIAMVFIHIYFSIFTSYERVHNICPV